MSAHASRALVVVGLVLVVAAHLFGLAHAASRFAWPAGAILVAVVVATHVGLVGWVRDRLRRRAR